MRHLMTAILTGLLMWGGSGCAGQPGARDTVDTNDAVPQPGQTPPPLSPVVQASSPPRDFPQVVYVIDASGSMSDKMYWVIAEAVGSIRKLSPDIHFTVVFFQRGHAIDVPEPRPGLRGATEYNKRRVIDWIATEAGNIVAGGSSDPIPALERAISYQPDLIFLLSDGFDSGGRNDVDQQAIFDAIDQAMDRHGMRPKINTIQFFHPDPLGTMEKIAERYGGRYKFIDEQMMHRRH